MITAIVQFELSSAVTREQARELFSASAFKYRHVPGLVRKYYLYGEDGRSAGGVYLWQSRIQAEQLYNAEWRQSIEERFGSSPSITYFESPVIVDNELGLIQGGDE